MQECEMLRIVCHWTAGAYKASMLDKEHYHIMIENDGKLVQGDHTIDDNVSTGDDDYAAHTRRFNSKAIGIAVCCMAGAEEKPFKPGPTPMLELQWNTMAQVAAELATFYRIVVNERNVLGHGEVQRVHGVTQNGKWDPMVLPWNTSLTKKQVGDAFRAKVQSFMS
jgi:hypothetical protein